MSANEQIKLRLRRNTFNYTVTGCCSALWKSNRIFKILSTTTPTRSIRATSATNSGRTSFTVKRKKFQSQILFLFFFLVLRLLASSSFHPDLFVHLQIYFCWAVAVVVWQGNRKIHNKFSNTECWRQKAHTCMHARDRNNFILPHPPSHPIRSDPCLHFDCYSPLSVERM